MLLSIIKSLFGETPRYIVIIEEEQDEFRSDRCSFDDAVLLARRLEFKYPDKRIIIEDIQVYK